MRLNPRLRIIAVAVGGLALGCSHETKSAIEKLELYRVRLKVLQLHVDIPVWKAADPYKIGGS